MSRKVISLEGWLHALRTHRQDRLASEHPKTYISPRVPQIIATALAEGAPFLLGDWLVEPGLNRLSRGQTSVQLALRAMDVLVCLAARAGEVVSRQELIDSVWDTEYVAYNTLASRIGDLRQALGDSAKQPHYIETIPKRGYRLIVPVTTIDAHETSVEPFPRSETEASVERSPYPGLTAFTTADAANFFGREAEVTALWRRIISRRLLAVFGPSGVGKSSLLRAGVIPAAPEGWRALVFQPGEAPSLSLARALAPELAGDAGGVTQLLGFEDSDVALAAVSRWRGRWDQALVVVDQFEELFTLNPPEVQARFVALLRRLVDAADVHVVLAMRDDFLHECNAYTELAPIFRELTPLSPPAGKDLRRAMTEPAARHLYRFEDRFLVDEMVDEVAEERAALPLLAFAVARLWELRDHAKRQLTREAYQQIGGVSGALARHAEETLNVIGEGRLPIVRELFRNLVTAKGTRATRGMDELLSVFGPDPGAKPPGREEKSVGDQPPGRTDTAAGRGFSPRQSAAAEVLSALVDARLLTSFEEHTPDGEEVARHHRVEVVHESLLASWPRLVRWQAQDAEGALLRDQLRQAALAWEERCRPSELLWTGSPYREFVLWRERYPGGLTDTEEAFSHAMTAFATRRQRRRRLVAASVMLAAVTVAAAMTGLWRRSELETRRAEANRLLALGRLELDESPTAAVAYALASLELTDTPTARTFALEALWRGPTQIRLDESERPFKVDFSPDGMWLAVGRRTGEIELWPVQGGKPRLLRGHTGNVWTVKFGPDSEVLVSVSGGDRTVRVWSVSTGTVLRSLEFENPTRIRLCAGKRQVVIFTMDGEHWLVRAWPLYGGEPRALGRFYRGERQIRLFNFDVDPAGTWLAYADGQTLRLLPLEGLDTVPSRALGSHDAEIQRVVFHPDGEHIASADERGQIRLWSLMDGSTAPVRTLSSRPMAISSLKFDRFGSRLAATGENQTIHIWDLEGPPNAEPLLLRPGEVLQVFDLVFHPDGRWVATADSTGVALWPSVPRYARVFRGHRSTVMGLAIAPDGTWIATSSQRTIRIWPLLGASRAFPHTPPRGVFRMAAHPSGRYLLGGSAWGNTYLMSVPEGRFRDLGGFSDQVWAVAFSPDGRLAAAGGGQNVAEEAVVRVWDVETGAVVRILDAGHGKWISQLQFTANGRLVEGSGAGLRLWDLETRTFRVLRQLDTMNTYFSLGSGDRRVVSAGFDLETLDVTEILLQDLETGETKNLSSQGTQGLPVGGFDPSGEFVVTVDATGAVRAGPVTGEEQHLLLGHDGMIWAAEVTPDGRRIASTGTDGTLRLWPMPDMSQPPFHTLPYDELLKRLRALTNLRVVEDEGSPTGYRVEAGPFPGWETVPEW